MKFQVGDRVRLVDAFGDSSSPARVGDCGVVLGEGLRETVKVRMDDGHTTSRNPERWEHVELVLPADPVALAEWLLA